MPPELHSAFGASIMSRILACPPSARLGQKFKDRFGSGTSPWAEEGTKAHALAEIKVRREIYKADKMSAKTLGHMSKKAQDNYQGINPKRFKALYDAMGDIPEDMEKATDIYTDIVIERYLTAKEYDASAQIFVEHRIDYGEWVRDGFGTADCVIVSDSLLEVLDYKHGKGVAVSAVDNPQARTYALGAYASFRNLFEFDKVRCTIVQPRIQNITEETITVEDLLHWAETVVVPAAKLAYEGKGDFSVGEHCRFCPVKAVCVARVAKAVEMFKYGLDEPGVIPDNTLSEILPLLDSAEEWITDIREYAEKKALNGEKVYGYKLVRGRKPNRAWTNAEQAEAKLLSLGYGDKQIHETKLLSVGKIETLVGKSSFGTLMGELVYQGEGKPVLVPESDAREEINNDITTKVEDILGGI